MNDEKQWPPPELEPYYFVKRVKLYDGRSGMARSPQDGLGDPVVAVDCFTEYRDVLLRIGGGAADIIFSDRALTVPLSRLWEYEVDSAHEQYRQRLEEDMPKAIRAWRKAKSRPDIDDTVDVDPMLR